jgi:hypothetical protein
MTAMDGAQEATLDGVFNGANDYFQRKSQQTIAIERMVREGLHSLSSIARSAGVSQQRVSYIKKRMREAKQSVEQPVVWPVVESKQPAPRPLLNTITLQLSPAVYDALSNVLLSVNRQTKQEAIEQGTEFQPTTVEEYIEECLMVNLAERGLLKVKMKLRP